MDARITWDLFEMLHLRREGWPFMALAAKYEKDHTTIIHHCKRYGVEPLVPVIRKVREKKIVEPKAVKVPRDILPKKHPLKEKMEIVCCVCRTVFMGHATRKVCSSECRKEHHLRYSRKFKPENFEESSFKYDEVIDPGKHIGKSYKSYLKKAMSDPVYQHYFQSERIVSFKI